jgi:Regulator of chromosome condensation (RCC1) repeat
MSSLNSAMKKRKGSNGGGDDDENTGIITSPSKHLRYRVAARSTQGYQNDAFRATCQHFLHIGIANANEFVRNAMIEADVPKENSERVRLANEYSMQNGDGTQIDYDCPTSAYTDLMSEYFRMVQDIKSRYGSSVPNSTVNLSDSGEGTAIGVSCGGEIVGMGSDDMNQLGVPTKKKVKSTSSTPSKPFSKNRNTSDDDDNNNDDSDDEKEPVNAPFIKKGFPIPNNMFRAISAGGMHSVVLSIDGDAYTWGNTDDGALGRDFISRDDAETEPRNNFVAPEHAPGIVTGFTTVDGKKEDGTIVQAVAGDNHILFLTLAGNVYQCGMYKDMDSGKFCDENNKGNVIGGNPKPVHVHQITSRVKAIFTLASFNAALLEDDSIVTWGFGCKGELARSANMTTKDPKDGLYDLTKAFFYDLTSGKPRIDIVKKHFLRPQAPIWSDSQIRPKKIVIAVATGAFHLLVAAREPDQGLKSRLYSSGLNNYGQLGHGDIYVDRHELTLVSLTNIQFSDSK